MPVAGRRLFLFLALVLVPGAVLIAATVRLARQERELSVQRQREARALIALQLGQELRTRLERLHADTAKLDSALVVRARLDGTRLVLPWEAAARVARPSAEVAALMSAGARAEFGTQTMREAAALYARAASLAHDSSVRAEASLLHARALRKAGNLGEARTVYRTLAAQPSSTRDDEGVPVSVYAADALLALGDTAPAQDALAALTDRTDLGPAALYAARSLAVQAAGDATTPLAVAFAQRLSAVEQLILLRDELPSLLAIAERAAGRPERVWLPFGNASWLVGVPGADAARSAEVSVARTDVLLRAIARERSALAQAAARARLTDIDSSAVEPAGAGFAGLHVLLPPGFPAPPVASVGALVALTLPVVLGLMLFSAYLLWRDVRREVAAATLRARFVSSVSHELKTPLTSIRMFGEMLRYGQLPVARREEYLDVVVNESERLTRLINNVLDFSRIDRGERPYQRDVLHLRDVVRDAARAMSYPVAQEGFELSLRIDDSVPPVLAERDAITQAVLNLLSNALKYSGESRTIVLELLRDGADAVIRVIDGGPGVRPDERRAIFEPYYRSCDAQAAGVPGTGLGLALVAHVAHGHGGSADVTPAPGGGSVFSLRIPLIRDDAYMRAGGASEATASRAAAPVEAVS